MLRKSRDYQDEEEGKGGLQKTAQTYLGSYGGQSFGGGGRERVVGNSLWLNALSSRFRNSGQLDKAWRFKVLAQLSQQPNKKQTIHGFFQKN